MVFRYISGCLFFVSFTFALDWSCFEGAGRYYGIDPYLLYSIASVESGLNPRAIGRNKNGTYDRGLMQINSSWDSYLRKHGIDPALVWDPCYSVYIGAMVLRGCVNRYGVSWRAVDCYNKGARARELSVYVLRVYRKWQQYSYMYHGY